MARRATEAAAISRSRARLAFFEAGMDARVEERAMLEADLRAAIRCDEVRPYFQPLIDLDTGKIAGYELLARWRCPKRGLVPPDVFIPVAEEIGLIGELTARVLARGCSIAREWADPLRIAINMSPVQLRDLTLPQRLLQIMTEQGFPPSRLEVEITEDSLVSDFATARVILTSLKNLGVRISLDDFGTGYSSLRHLRELPLDVLKIDKSFVMGIDGSDQARSIVRTIIQLAQNLGLRTTAEGVESAAVATALRELGCDIGQGYYFGAPQASALHLKPQSAAAA